MKRALTILFSIALGFIATGFITILCQPLWATFESATGIESVGHSGPAGWCYAFTFVVLVVCILLVTLRRKNK
jgi:hypothetical protein